MTTDKQATADREAATEAATFKYRRDPAQFVEGFLAGIAHERQRLREKMNGSYGLGPVSDPMTHAARERWQDSIVNIAHRLAERRHSEQEGEK